MIVITPFYASLLAFVFIVLARNTIGARRKAQVLLGDGGNNDLLAYIRAHGNFAEYVPFALLLIAFAELQGLQSAIIHLLCGLLLIGRLVHAYGLSKRLDVLAFRVFGVATTFITLITSAVANLILSVGRFYAGV